MEKPNYKYQDEINTVETICPPNNFILKNEIAFRWVFESMEDEQNFSPQYFKNAQLANQFQIIGEL